MVSRVFQAQSKMDSFTELFAIRILPRGEIMEELYSQSEAETYITTFNRVMAGTGVRAEMVPLESLEPGGAWGRLPTHQFSNDC